MTRQTIEIGFGDLIFLADVLDQYRLAMKNAKPDLEVSATHMNLKKRITKLIQKYSKEKHILLPGVRREWVYLRNVIFQYFIGLLKLGIENEDLRYREVYNRLGSLIDDPTDEIEKLLSMIENAKIGP